MIDASLLLADSKTGSVQNLTTITNVAPEPLQLTDMPEDNFSELFLSQLFPVETLTELTSSTLLNLGGNTLPDGKDLPLLASPLQTDFITATTDAAETGINPVISVLFNQSNTLSNTGKVDELKLSIRNLLGKTNTIGEQDIDIVNILNKGPSQNNDKQNMESMYESRINQFLLNKLNSRDVVNTIDNTMTQHERTAIAGVKIVDNIVSRQSLPDSTGMVKLLVETPLNQPQWGQSLAGRVSMMIANNHQAAQININPPELGPIEVRITIKNDQANVNFFAHHSEVRAAIEAALPKLEELLGRNGMTLGESNVSEHSLTYGQEQNEDINSDKYSDLHDRDLENEGLNETLIKQVSIGLIDHFV